jgi:hypothetical protein
MDLICGGRGREQEGFGRETRGEKGAINAALLRFTGRRGRAKQIKQRAREEKGGWSGFVWALT